MQDSEKRKPSESQEEVKVIEFSIGDSSYGVSIDQVKEIIAANIMVVPVPDALPTIEGAINLRGRIIPLINLAKFLNADTDKIGRIIISEFQQNYFGFGVTEVAKLHSVSARDIEDPLDLLQAREGYVVGISKINERILYLLDLKKIAQSINA